MSGKLVTITNSMLVLLISCSVDIVLTELSFKQFLSSKSIETKPAEQSRNIVKIEVKLQIVYEFKAITQCFT